MTVTRTNDLEMYYEQHGDPAAEPVLLIMGFGGNAGAWAPQIPALAERFHVIAFDNRGAGRTTQPDGPYTIPQMAGDAAALLDALNIDSAHVMGASMGGMIAQEFALRYPRRVRTLALLCTTPGGPRSFGYDTMRDALAELDGVTDLTAMQTPERLQEAMLKMFTPEYLKAPGDGFQAMILSAVQFPSTIAGVKGQMAAIVAHDTLDRLPRIAVPTLVATGADDTLVDARNSRLLAERIPNAELREFAGLRHGFTGERPDLVNPVLLEFLAKHTAVAA